MPNNLPKALPIGTLDKKELLQSYLKQQRKDPTSYSITSRGTKEAVASVAGQKRSSSSSASVVSSTSWQSQRYQQAKLRSRQSIQAKKKQPSKAAQEKENSKIKSKSLDTKEGSGNVKSVLKDIKNSPIRNHNQQVASKKAKDSHREQPERRPSVPINSKSNNAVKQRIQLSHDNTSETLNSIVSTWKSSSTPERNGNRENVVSEKVATDKNTNDAKVVIAAGFKPEKNEKIETKENKKKLQIQNPDEIGSIRNKNIRNDALNQMTSDESFEEFMNELTREMKSVDHVELFNSFHAFLNGQAGQPITPSSTTSNDSKKRKRVKLSSKTTTHLKSINQFLRKKVRKSHCANESQVMTDRQLKRERRSRSFISSKERSGRGDDSSSLASKQSSKSSSLSPNDKKGKNWKTKLLKSRKNSVDDGDSSNTKKLPEIIKLPQDSHVSTNDDNKDGLHSVASANSSSIDDDKDASQIHHHREKQESNKNTVPKFKRSLRPPLPPTNYHSSNNNEQKKPPVPRWRVALIEKQKARRREERLRAEANDDDDDNKSINTVDLERSAEDAVGKSRVISLFGKLVNLRPKQDQPAHATTIESDDGNQSPWAIKLKPVNRKSMGGGDFTPRELLASTPAQYHDLTFSKRNHTTDSLPNTLEGCTPHPTKLKPNHSALNSIGNNENKEGSIKFNLNPGDVIDLNELPEPEFMPDKKPIIVPITNNNGNRNQIVILGDNILLIASRFDETDSCSSDKANVLWYTARSQIVTLALNNKADGVSISIENGTSFPLNFENCNQCFSFVQTYYNMIQPEPQKTPVEEDPFMTPRTNRTIPTKTPSNALVQGSTTSSIPYATPIIDPDRANQFVDSLDDESIGGLNEAAKKVNLSRYRNMLKCGVPPDAVRHQMNKDGVDSKDQESAFLPTPDKEENQINALTDQSDSVSKGDIANMLQNHFQKQVPNDELSTTIKTPVTKTGIASMLEGHLKSQLTDITNLPETKDVQSSPSEDATAIQVNQTPNTKSGIASMLEGHLKSQLTYVKSQTPTRQKETLTKEDEDKISKYRKMLKVGMPKDAVLHAMKRDRVNDKIVEAIKSTINNQLSDPVGNQWSLEEEKILTRFKKMLRLNVPPDAVRNKMVLEKVDKKLIEEVLGKSDEETPKKTEEQSHEVKDSQTLDNTIVSKFKKMLKMGIPPEAVRHAMVKENVDSNIIASVLGIQQEKSAVIQQIVLSEDEQKEVEKYKKMIKMGLPSDAVRHKMTMEKADKKVISAVLDDGTQTENCALGTSQKRKKSNLINFHWEKLPSDKVENTNSFWARSAKKPKFDADNIDLDALQEIFKKPTNDKKPSHKSSSQEKEGNKMARILDINRAQNVSISLQAFKQFSLDQLVDIIKDLDANNEIKGDRVQFLTGLLPKTQEVDAIQKYEGEEKFLIHAEVFFKKLLSVPRMETKIKVIQTMELFNQNFEDTYSRYNVLQATCKDVIKSDKLQLILESVLAIGNIMNQGTYSGDAQGIKFDSLLKLTQTKSKDKKMSILDYIVMMFVGKKERNVLELSDDFPECSTASRILITDVEVIYTSLEKSLKDCKREMIKMKNEQLQRGFSPGFLRFEAFMEKSETAMSQLKEVRAKASGACKELAEYCGEDGGERAATTLLETLTEFTKSIEGALLKYDREQERKAKKEAQKKKESSDNEANGTFKEQSLKTKKKPNHFEEAKIRPNKALKRSHGNHDTSKKGTETNNALSGEELANDSTVQSMMKKQANDTLQACDPRTALLQSISKMKSDDETTNIKNVMRQNNNSLPTDPRTALLQSITQRKSTDDKNMNKTSQTLNNKKINRPIRNKLEVVNEEGVDPRKAMLQSIVQRRTETDDASDIENPFPINSSNQLLHNILKRKITEEDQSTGITMDNNKTICMADEENEGSNGDERKVCRSSRSLSCGIVPDWDIAISTFDPSRKE